MPAGEWVSPAVTDHEAEGTVGPQFAADAPEERRVVEEGDLELVGRIMPASNATYLAEVTLGEATVRCVYKPVSGERPLWDFPDRTLARREAAAYAVSEALGWDLVPLTLLREGPNGPGMVQVWRDPSEEVEAVDLVPAGEVPEGFLSVLDATDGAGNDVTLIHEDTPQLRRMALFDAVVNNADRKGGHVLAMPDGHRYAVDHGICFHVEDKLRTVLWGWAGQPLEESETAALTSLMDQLQGRSGLHTVLGDLLSEPEVIAVRMRCLRLLRARALPVPSQRWPAIPWPAF